MTTRVAGAVGSTDHAIYSRVVLDWRAYFYLFVERHGEPILYEDEPGLEGFLLFPDGWRYAVNYEGPEFEPPRDSRTLKSLLETYWRIRKANLVKERDALQRQIKWLKHRQELTDIPLQQRVYYRDRTENGGSVLRATKEATDLNLDGVKFRMEDLNLRIRECESKQKEIG